MESVTKTEVLNILKAILSCDNIDYNESNLDGACCTMCGGNVIETVWSYSVNHASNCPLTKAKELVERLEKESK